MWQALYEELSEKGFVVIAVSFDTRAPDASRPFIEAAHPTHPSLLDPDHHVADIYNMVNIPNAVWIDENGRIVRPTESAGTGDEFRMMVRPGGIPADDRLRMAARRARYIDAIRDWVEHEAASRFVLQPEDAAHRARVHSPDDAQAFAHFRFGTWLARQGRYDESQSQLEIAVQLKPDSWAIKRQTWELQEVGKAGGPEFWAAVEALGTGQYYPPADLDGIA
ncbi:MAG: hypothetical protein QOJ66_2722 [Ilumatobacteraceae bacterium]